MEPSSSCLLPHDDVSMALLGSGIDHEALPPGPTEDPIVSMLTEAMGHNYLEELQNIAFWAAHDPVVQRCRLWHAWRTWFCQWAQQRRASAQLICKGLRLRRSARQVVRLRLYRTWEAWIFWWDLDYENKLRCYQWDLRCARCCLLQWMAVCIASHVVHSAAAPIPMTETPSPPPRKRCRDECVHGDARVPLACHEKPFSIELCWRTITIVLCGIATLLLCARRVLHHSTSP